MMKTYKENTHPEIWAKYGPVKEETDYVYALKWSPKWDPKTQTQSSSEGTHTIHGLWPNFKEGERTPTPIDWNTKFLDEPFEDPAYPNSTLRSILNQYWESDLKGHSNESFWAHEWNKHGRNMPSKWVDLKKVTVDNDLKSFFTLCVLLFKRVPNLYDINLEEHKQVEFHVTKDWDLIELRSNPRHKS